MERRVFLIRNVAPEKFGGAEVYQLKLAGKLKEAGFCPVILTNSEELLKRAKKAGIQTLVPPYSKRQNWSGVWNLGLPFYFLYQLRLRKWYKKIFRKYKPEVVNIQSRDDWIAATRVARRCGIRILWTDHMDFRSWVLTNVEVWYKNLVGKWILRCARKADKIIMISDFERESFESIVSPRKYKNLITIKNGAEDDYAQYKQIKPVKQSICYIGRIVDYKGIGELIEAFNKISEKYSDARLNIYGDGEDLKKYKGLAEKNARICFYGRTSEPLKAMAENEIFVLPSYREGLSLSLLDAAMMKKEIIASRVDGNPEIVINNKTGFLVPAKNVEALAEKIEYLLDNPKSAETLAKNARKLYEEKFNFDKIFAEKMLPLYNRAKEKK